MKQVRRAVNDGLRKGNQPQADVQTKVYAQTFCSWAEANFSKVIHTPKGFTLAELAEVKRTWSDRSLADGWNKAVQLGLRKVPAQRSGFLPNARQTIERLIDKYVRDPALIRNKIAHGQWSTALNRSNTNINQELTTAINSLNIVDIERWHGGHTRLAGIVESLIESPERTFSRDYWPQLIDLEQYTTETATWTLEARVTALQEKWLRYRNGG
ncbi:hypothetical protein [Sphingomonas sp.]|uniref:hypothetical protein n=1 Tax=Sphingomonas sp. TaxID=28214 RepID=UPI003F6F0825